MLYVVLFNVLLRGSGLVLKCSIFCCSWDEWVGMDRLMKPTEENMRKKRALDEKHGIGKNPKVPRGPLAKSKSTNGQTVLFCTFIDSIPLTSCVSCL